MQAVILAAGMGTRIRDIHALPKGFIALGEETLIDRMIRHLHDVGITDILIVTGFEAVYYEKLKVKYHTLQTVFNPHYDCYSSLYSLYCARDFICDDFLLLESDIIFEKRAIASLLQNTNHNAILLSGATQSSDEVYVEAHAEKLVKMSKDKNNLQKELVLGEFVGINKISLHAYSLLLADLQYDKTLLEQGHYEEHGLVKMAKYAQMHCVKIDDLLWGEIDNEFQLKRMQNLYPEICQTE